MTYKVLIADDELIAGEILQKQLQDYPQVNVIAVCKNGKEALTAIEKHQPDLVFLDIQMPELNGIDLAKSLNVEKLPVIIFVTAFDNYALQAFEANAIDYLLKPFDKERFDKTFQKAMKQLQLTNKEDLSNVFDKYSQFFQQFSQPSYPEIVTVKDGGRIQLLKTADLMYIEAEGNYISLQTEKSKHLLYETLSSFEQKLNPKTFVRIHRSTIVNINFIKEIQSHFNGDYSVLLKNTKVLRMSRNYKENLIH
ncbi:LytR/AlgR family response regulator transcription factor [Emticicia agri]|uniref:Response regulator transcription factor n=1 Tax=Emticicia agri TaxID=2492393 RepID=A0A4Q5M3C1_9BACT|nr:LytTR family DNA-binding domain-containing protein [Emticicia agri]RYU96635.1 response regulator transcription factor [Emticicia agri]